MLYTLDMPGAFDSYFSGSGVAQGQGVDADEKELHAAYKSARTIRSGKGYRLRLTVGLEAAELLASYAETCLHLNSQSYGENDSSELAAARKLLERIEQATGGRLRYDGWSLLLDGERVS